MKTPSPPCKTDSGAGLGFRILHRFSMTGLRLFPIAQDIKNYGKYSFKADGTAALAGVLLALPQALAYALIAGVPLVYGVICAAIGAMVAPVFAGSRFTVIGPTNATSLMLFSFLAMNPAVAARHEEMIPLLVLMIGLLATIAAMARLADFLQYVSRSVLVGYISGAAILIIVSQMMDVLGIADQVSAEAPSSFIGRLIAIAKAMPDAHLISLLIGVSTIVIHAMIRKLRPHWPAFAIALFVASAVFGPLIRLRVGPFADIATFQTFVPGDLMPSFPSLLRTGIFEDVATLVGIALALAFLGTLENSLMSKSLASRSGGTVDSNQDMFSVGMANIASAFAGGMPASGSLTRSALNFESGAVTRFSSIFTGMLTLSAAIIIAWLAILGAPLIDFIPRAALAALVICIAVTLFNRRNIRICFKSTRDDQRVLVITLISTLLAPLDVAIFIGVAVSIAFFLRRASHPTLVEYEFSDEGELREKPLKDVRPNPSISIVHVEGDLFFGAADVFRHQVERAVDDPNLKVIILRMRNARLLDATSAMALEDFVKHTRERGIFVLISGVARPLYKVLKDSGILETIQQGANRKEGESNLFVQFPSNPNLSTRDALRRAQQLLGQEKADIRIFHNPKPTPTNP